MILSSWVPHQLSERSKKERVECCQALIMLYHTYGFVFLASHLLVHDESWFYWDSSEQREVWMERYTWILHNGSADRQSDQNLASKPFLWDAWVKCKTVSNPKSPKKHDAVYHFGPSQMVLELINLRQSFPNNLIIDTRNYDI